MLKNFLFTRPDWFRHEGYWRLAQVLRLGPTFTFLAISALFFAVSFYKAGIGDDDLTDAFGFAVAWLAGAVVYVVAMHWLVRLIVWVKEGFKEGIK